MMETTSSKLTAMSTTSTNSMLVSVGQTIGFPVNHSTWNRPNLLNYFDYEKQQ